MKRLVMQASKGDAEAFIRLMENNKCMLYKIAKGYLKGEEDIADAIQETMLAAFERTNAYQRKEGTKEYSVIARNYETGEVYGSVMVVKE